MPSPATEGTAPPWRHSRALRRTALGLALFALFGMPGAALAAYRDSSYTRAELGAATDVTNEQFFEDTYSDTLFLGRRLSSTPEARTGAAFSLDLQRTTPGADWWLRSRLDARLGDKLQRLDWNAQWRSASDHDWRAQVSPLLVLRSDRSFGETRREVRARLAGRITHPSLDEANTFDLAGAGELSRSQASATDYLLDRNAAELSAGWDHAAPFGAWAWRLRWTGMARAFPDSTDRDHIEQRGEAGLEWLGLAGSLFSHAELARRQPRRDVFSTRDDYWAGQADVAVTLRPGAWGSLEAGLASEGYRYHLADSLSYFDYQLQRARVAARFELPRGYSLSAGPAAEWLVAADAPGERYEEWGAALSLERVTGRSWWELAPAAGVRRYLATGDVAALSGHSDYRYAELQLLVDQPLPALCWLRLSASARLEKHDDPSQDARSFYFSLDLRRLL